MVVAPYPRLAHGIALTGRQRLERLDHRDDAAIELFIERVAGRYSHGWQHGATDCMA